MASLTNITITSRSTATATFDAVMDELSVRAAGWLLAPTGDGLESSIVRADLQTGGLVCLLTVSPPMSAGATYHFQADKALTAAGAALVVDAQNAVATAETLDMEPSARLGYRASFVTAFAKELRRLAAPPCTRVVDEFLVGDERLSVETTLDFPSSGTLMVRNRRFDYTGTEGAKFLGLVERMPSDGETLLEGELVVLDLQAVE